MAYDEELADRIRAAVVDDGGVTERHMLGGLASLVHGHVAVSVSSRGGLLLRVDPAEAESLVRDHGVTRFEARRLAMQGWLQVAPSVVASDDPLRHWLGIGITCAGSLSPK